MSKMDLLREIHKFEKSIGSPTLTEKQHLVNFLNNNYISKVRAIKIELALGLEKGYISDFVTSKKQGLDELERLMNNDRKRETDI